MIRQILAALAFALPVVGGCAEASRTDDQGSGVDSRLADARWLSGFWATQPPLGSQTEEVWTLPRGGTMLGMARMLEGLPIAPGGPSITPRTVSFEHLRIELTPEGDIVYLASPNGRVPPTAFKRVPMQAAWVLVFENPGHDFPRRITYRRTGPDAMLVRIEGEENGKPASQEWTMTRLAPAPRP